MFGTEKLPKWHGKTAGADRVTRQWVRAELRAKHGDAPGKLEYRRLRGLPEMSERSGGRDGRPVFKSHVFGPVAETFGRQ